MTNEEAIEILKGAIKKPNTKDGYLGQALDIAIKAIEQQPFINKPCISEGVCREDKIKVLDKISAEIHDKAVKTRNGDKRDGLYIAREIVDRYR